MLFVFRCFGTSLWPLLSSTTLEIRVPVELMVTSFPHHTGDLCSSQTHGLHERMITDDSTEFQFAFAHHNGCLFALSCLSSSLLHSLLFFTAMTFSCLHSAHCSGHLCSHPAFHSFILHGVSSPCSFFDVLLSWSQWMISVFVLAKNLFPLAKLPVWHLFLGQTLKS